MAEQFRVITPVANLFDAHGKLDRQLLFGEGFDGVLNGGHVKGTRRNNAYAGCINANDLGKWSDPTNRVKDLGGHVYPEPNIKTIPLMHLPYQAELTVVDEVGDFVELTGGGFVHQSQIESITAREDDLVRTAERYLGVPYLWGGNSQYGIDCSGLITAALHSIGVLDQPSNTGGQSKKLGQPLSESEELRRGDFVFWKGHVGIMFNQTLLLHANGHHMKVAFEPLAEATARIAASGGGDVTARRRL